MGVGFRRPEVRIGWGPAAWVPASTGRYAAQSGRPRADGASPELQVAGSRTHVGQYQTVATVWSRGGPAAGICDPRTGTTRRELSGNSAAAGTQKVGDSCAAATPNSPQWQRDRPVWSLGAPRRAQRRRRVTLPSVAKPASINAQVPGSGTAVTGGTVPPVAVRNTPESEV